MSGLAAQLDRHRRWLIASLGFIFLAVLAAQYVLMHSGIGERASSEDCWSGAALADAVEALGFAGCALSVLLAASVARIWRWDSVVDVWRIGATLALATGGILAWGIVLLFWVSDPACGI